LKIKPKFSIEDLAVRIKSNDEYLGYLAWAEVYLTRPEKVDFGLSVLKELVDYYPNNMEAYL
jgi:hypothetical protein